MIIGASGGIGQALMDVLKRQISGTVSGLSRTEDHFDISCEASIAKAAAKFQENKTRFSLIIVATGVLDTEDPMGTIASPEKSFRELSPNNALHSFTVNALGPALVFKHFAPLMTKQHKAIFCALSARVGSIGDNHLGGWMSYRASKAALNQFIRCAAIEHRRTHPDNIVIALHPGTIKTPLTEKYARNRYTATPQEAATQILDTLGKLEPSDTGDFFAYDGNQIEW